MDFARVIDFWFCQIAPAQWWRRDAALDRRIAQEFGALHLAAVRCELYAWRAQPSGRLAEIIILDQFSRNMHRDCPHAFASDPLALALAQEAVANGSAAQLARDRRAFLYMPYMHSESRVIHEAAVERFSEPGLEANLRSELQHKAIIDHFGRYPHRNAALGRASTEEEQAFILAGSAYV